MSKYRLTKESIINTLKHDFEFNECLSKVNTSLDYDTLVTIKRLYIKDNLNSLEMLVDIGESHLSPLQLYRTQYMILKAKEQLYFMK